MGGVEGHAGEAGYMIFFGLGAQWTADSTSGLERIVLY